MAISSFQWYRAPTPPLMGTRFSILTLSLVQGWKFPILGPRPVLVCLDFIRVSCNARRDGFVGKLKARNAN